MIKSFKFYCLSNVGGNENLEYQIEIKKNEIY